MTILSESSFRVGGLVSGLDTDSIVSQYMEIERKPQIRLESKKSEINEKLTAWRDLNTRTLSLQIQANRLKSESYFSSREATSSNTDVLTVSASAGESTSYYTVTVMALAQNHQMSTQSYSTEDAEIGTGTVSITVDGTTQDITLDEDNNTLEGLRDAINEGNLGVNAGIVQANEDDYRLVITSDTKGADGQIELTTDLSGGESTVFSTIQEAQDAHIKLGSGESAIDVYRSTNNINDVIDGVSIKLKSVDTENPVNISLGNDTEKPRAAIDNFIEQYNAMVDYFDQQFMYDSESGETGTLFSENSLLGIKQQLYSAVTNPVMGDGEYHNLVELGIGVGSGGYLEVQDESLLNDALENHMDEVSTFFTDDESGLGDRVANYLDEIMDTEEGIIYTIEDSFVSEIEELDDAIAQKEEYYSSVETRYYQKFTDLEVAMAELQSQSSYLNYQIDAMSGSSSQSATDYSS